MQKKVEAYIRKWDMLSPEDMVIAGVSGGADSVCLFYLLEEMADRIGFEMTVVHVNHGIRGASAEADEEYVRRLCEEHGVSFKCFRVNVPELVREEKLSEEEAGRLARRRIFEDVMAECGGTKIALAHHQDDNAETFLLHAARGSRLKGLGGIYPVNGAYIRPLLCVTRKEIEGYLERNGIDYCIDESNAEDTYTRNRIRSHVLPYFTEYINPRTVEHLNEAMEQLREIQEFMEHQTEKAFARCVSGCEEGLFVREDKLAVEEGLLKRMILRKTLTTLCRNEKDIEDVHVQLLEQLFQKQTGRVFCLPYGMRALRTYGGIRLELETGKKQHADPAGHGRQSEAGDELILPVLEEKEGRAMYGDTEIAWSVFPLTDAGMSVPKKTYTKWFDYDIIGHDIGVRTRRPGDRIVVDGRGSTQKLKSYFINEKIPAGRRDEIPLIVEGRDILWIAGYRQSKAYQVTGGTTTILEIRINGGTCNGGDS